MIKGLVNNTGPLFFRNFYNSYYVIKINFIGGIYYG